MSTAYKDLPTQLRPVLRRPGLGWWAAVLVCLALLALGVFGYLQQRLHGDIVTGMRTVGKGGAVWGLYIMFDIVFVGLAFAGVTIMTVSRIFRLRDMRPYSRLAGIMAIASLSMAGLCVIADLGRPLTGLLNLPKYARTMSPFFGTFTMIIGAGLSSTLILVYLSSRSDARLCSLHLGKWAPLYRLVAMGYRDTGPERSRHRIVSRVLSLVMLPMMVLAYSTLGFVFGVQSGRPGWFSALQAPNFVVLAAISGLGLLLFISGASARWLGLGELLPARAYRWLTNALWVLIVVFLYFSGVEELTARYAASSAQTSLAHEMTSGVYAPAYWTSGGLFVLCFVVLFGQFSAGKQSVPLTMAVGLLVNAAAILKRYLIVVPSQTHGTLLGYENGSYFPTWVEFSVIGGLIALGTLIFLVLVRVFPMVPLQGIGPVDMPQLAVTRPGRRLVRHATTYLCLIVGVVCAVMGLLWSARYGTKPIMDPVVPYSPVLFIIGATLCLGSAVVFELFPRALAPLTPTAPAPSEPD